MNVRSGQRRRPAVLHAARGACRSALVGSIGVVSTLLLAELRHTRETTYYDVTGTTAYYEVHYGDQPLVLPKDLFGAAADIDRFFVAADFPPEATDNDSVLLGFTPSLLLPGGSTKAGELMFVYARSAGRVNGGPQVFDQQRQLLGVITTGSGS